MVLCFRFMKNHSIHRTAIVHPKSRIGDHVQIGPYTVVEEDVLIGDETVIWDHVHIGRGTTIGKNNSIHIGAVIGHQAQHKVATPADGFLKIGDHNVFREYVTVHRGAEKESTTLIGDDNYFMAFSHVGHDCLIKNHTTVTNSVLLAGHVELQDHCVLGGGAGIHQFCRIGSYAMIGGHASVTRDVPPYTLMDDGEDLIGSINIIGLRRAGFAEETKRDIKNAYKLLYLSGLSVVKAAEAIAAGCHSAEAVLFLEFIKNSKRGVLGHRRQKVKISLSD